MFEGARRFGHKIRESLVGDDDPRITQALSADMAAFMKRKHKQVYEPDVQGEIGTLTRYINKDGRRGYQRFTYSLDPQGNVVRRFEEGIEPK